MDDDVAEEVRAGMGVMLPAMIGGVPSWEVRQRGICVCGHRVMAHKMDGACHGVQASRRRYAQQTAMDCQCIRLYPVATVPDTRPFRATWLSAQPEHPFTKALYMLGDARVIAWLVDPRRCEVCSESGEDVRAVYEVGTNRNVSLLACRTCRPVAQP